MKNYQFALNSAKNLLNLRNTALKPLSYAQRVTSSNPCAFVLLVDQSGSMAEEMEDNKSEDSIDGEFVEQAKERAKKFYAEKLKHGNRISS